MGMKGVVYYGVMLSLFISVVSCTGSSKGKIDMPDDVAERIDGVNDDIKKKQISLSEVTKEEENVAGINTESVTAQNNRKLPKRGATYSDVYPELGEELLFDSEKELESFLNKYENTGRPDKSMYKEAETLLQYAMEEYLKRNDEGYEVNDEYRLGIMRDFLKRLYARCTDISMLEGIHSTDKQLHFVEYMANTQSVFHVLAYRKGKGYEVLFLENYLYASSFNRINKLEFSGDTYYLLNVKDDTFSLIPELFQMKNGMPVHCAIENADLWHLFYEKFNKKAHLDFNPKTLVWTQCEAGKNGTWQPIKGKLRIQLKQSHGKLVWTEY